jgi:hypothetical protein
MPGGSQFVFRVGLVSLLAYCSLPADAPTIEFEGKSKLGHMSAHSYQHAPQFVVEPCAVHLVPRRGYWICRYTLSHSLARWAPFPRRSEQKLYGEDDHFLRLLARHSTAANRWLDHFVLILSGKNVDR